MVLSRRKLVWVLTFVISFLIVAGVATQYYASIYKPSEFLTNDCHGVIRMFYLNGEGNAPSWFQSSMLLFCAGLLHVAGKREATTRLHRHWRSVAFVFLFLSLDEAASFHEGVGNQISHHFHTTGFLSFAYAWVIPGSLFVVAFVILNLRFLQDLTVKIRRQFIGAGCVYLCGVLVCEVLGGWYDSNHGSRDMVYLTVTVIEETLEGIGILLFIRALLTHIKEQGSQDHSHMAPLVPNQIGIHRPIEMVIVD